MYVLYFIRVLYASIVCVYLANTKIHILLEGDYKMSITYRKKTTKDYTQYTCRIETSILNSIKSIAEAEGISINACINQSLMFAIEDYYKKTKQEP